MTLGGTPTYLVRYERVPPLRIGQAIGERGMGESNTPQGKIATTPSHLYLLFLQVDGEHFYIVENHQLVKNFSLTQIPESDTLLRCATAAFLHN